MRRIEVVIFYSNHNVLFHFDDIEEAELLVHHELWECSYRDCPVTIYIRVYEDSKLISNRKYENEED